jgi:hypothetical protein
LAVHRLVSTIAASGVVAATLALSPIHASASVADNQLSAVSCITATACTAVGWYDTGGDSQALAERWNGTSWTIQSTAILPRSYLSGVACPTISACTAVGAYYNGTSYVTLAERWNGTAWQVQPTPNPTAGGSLYGVSCPTATDCTAVGQGGSHTLAERWNGTAWHIQSTPNLRSQFSFLDGVSCSTAINCTAVGTYRRGDSFRTLTERWNGTSWTVQSTPSPTSTLVTEAILTGVSCPTISDCTDVGYYVDTCCHQLTESWNGKSWTIQSSPNPSAVTSLSGVSCPTISVCTAVGWYNNGTSNVTMAERRNGATWTMQSTPNPVRAPVSQLLAVSCPTISDCTAVGVYDIGTSSRTLAERWNGTAWQMQTTP